MVLRDNESLIVISPPQTVQVIAQVPVVLSGERHYQATAPIPEDADDNAEDMSNSDANPESDAE